MCRRTLDGRAPPTQIGRLSLTLDKVLKLNLDFRGPGRGLSILLASSVIDKEAARVNYLFLRWVCSMVRGAGEVRAAFATLFCITRPGEFGFRIYRNNICFELLTK